MVVSGLRASKRKFYKILYPSFFSPSSSLFFSEAPPPNLPHPLYPFMRYIATYVIVRSEEQCLQQDMSFSPSPSSLFFSDFPPPLPPPTYPFMRYIATHVTVRSEEQCLQQDMSSSPSPTSPLYSSPSLPPHPLPPPIHSLDTFACCCDMKQPSKEENSLPDIYNNTRLPFHMQPTCCCSCCCCCCSFCESSFSLRGH